MQLRAIAESCLTTISQVQSSLVNGSLITIQRLHGLKWNQSKKYFKFKWHGKKIISLSLIMHQLPPVAWEIRWSSNQLRDDVESSCMNDAHITCHLKYYSKHENYSIESAYSIKIDDADTFSLIRKNWRNCSTESCVMFVIDITQ